MHALFIYDTTSYVDTVSHSFAPFITGAIFLSLVNKEKVGKVTERECRNWKLQCRKNAIFWGLGR